MDKKTLQSYKAMELELEQLTELIERVDARMYDAKTTKVTLTPKGGGFSGDAVSANLALLESLRALYNRRWDALIAARTEIETAIDCLSPTERLLMRYRYIEGLGWDKVAQKLHYSRRHTTRIHGEILQKIAQKEEKEG